MKETPEEIATRLMAPASPSALWTHAQVRALLIDAVKAGAAVKATGPASDAPRGSASRWA